MLRFWDRITRRRTRGNLGRSETWRVRPALSPMGTVAMVVAIADRGRVPDGELLITVNHAGCLAESRPTRKGE